MVDITKDNHIIWMDEGAYASGKVGLVGTADMSGGNDWSAGNETLVLNYNAEGDITITLVANCTNIAGVVAEIQSKIDVSYTDEQFLVGYDANNHITLSCNNTFILGAASTALVTLGFTAATYTATAYTVAALVDGDYKQLNYPVSGITLPNTQIMVDTYRAINADANTVELIPKGIKYTEGDLPLYLQNSDFLVRAFMKDGANIDGGDTLQSMLVHWYDADESWDAFGVEIQEIDIKVPTNDLVEQSIKTIHHSTDQGTTVTTNTDFITLATAKILHSSDVTLTIQLGGTGGFIDLEFVEFNFKISNTIDDKTQYVNHKYRRNPTFLNREVTVDITFKGNVANFRQALNADTITLDDIAITFAFTGGNETYTLSNITVDPENNNFSEIPEFGFYEYKATWIMGNGFTIVKS